MLRLVIQSEYKRRQAAPVLKVSEKAFGEGRRFPSRTGTGTDGPAAPGRPPPARERLDAWSAGAWRDSPVTGA